MRARLGPQEPGGQGTSSHNLGSHPDPMVTPWCRTFSRTVTLWSPLWCRTFTAPSGTTSWEKPPKRATHWLHQQKAGRHALHAFLLSYHSLRAPKGIPRQNSPHTMGPATPSIISCIIDSS
ncbi:hypothetical protein CK203_038885 [Vitis vinifera]|uniref:Uncharacterized protein n=1 Tax=Vitis vinifera TaxID=29760 RepID=A0A438HG25_VITVI|nr:hypothetical protein CK203_038885 [Vitis vinifera]